jgi:membrane-bound lytic murein transglycosylase B
MTRFAPTFWSRLAAAAGIALALVVAVAPSEAAPPRKAAIAATAKKTAAAIAAKRAAAEAARKADAAFRDFVEGLWPLAEARGVKRATFDAAFAGVTFDPRIVAHTTAQAEFTQPIWVYLSNAVSPARVSHGRARSGDVRSWLAKAERDYGVDAGTLMGVWGMESEFGLFSGGDSVVRALASLAFVHYQGDFFRDELIAALAILEEGDIAPQEMKGSWAGAMGQTQFMPSSFLAYAVDFEGHGRRDIWDSAPDAIGSTANFLAKHGWIAGAPWGFEVRLPDNFVLTAADSSRFAPFSSFAARGVTRADGGPWPKDGEAELLIPAGLKGPIFLITANFKAIKAYNNSTAYALGVALLGDAVMGRDGPQTAWPRRDKPLTEKEVRELQRALDRRGYEVGEIDGRVGDRLQAALRAYQESIGEPPDGYPTLTLLRRLRLRT